MILENLSGRSRIDGIVKEEGKRMEKETGMGNAQPDGWREEKEDKDEKGADPTRPHIIRTGMYRERVVGR